MFIVLVGNKNRNSVKFALKFFKKNFNNYLFINTEKINKQRIYLKLKKLNIDVLVSLYNYYIFPKDILNKTKILNINFHPGSSYFPGFGCYNFALMSKTKTYGCVAHEISPNIDQGKIINEIKFKFDNNCSVEKLQSITEIHVIKLFEEIFNYYLNKGNFMRKKNIKWKRKSFNRNDFNKLFNIDKKLNSNLLKVIKSTFHNNFSNVYNLDKYKITINEK
tara:strand:- start:96 stop:755 length:660 start_codon:yes stop_codon:yes gene_type:complete